MMRLAERAARRAALPLRYSQGYNPRPVLSLACPRPVGVASRDELLVLTLEEDIGPQDLPARLNQCSPPGMRVLEARPLEGKPRLVTQEFELPLREEAAAAVAARLEELTGQDHWPVERIVSPKQGRKEKQVRPVDLKPLIEDLRLDQGVLRWRLRPQGDLWARPGEVLALLGLDDRVDLARVERTAVEYKT